MSAEKRAEAREHIEKIREAERAVHELNAEIHGKGHLDALDAVIWSKPCPGVGADNYTLHVSGEKLRAAKAALEALLTGEEAERCRLAIKAVNAVTGVSDARDMALLAKLRSLAAGGGGRDE